MANDKLDVKKSMGQIKSPWLINTLKSMGVASTEVIKDLMPATSGTIKSTTAYANETVKNIRSNTSSGAVKNAIMNNSAVKMGQDYIRNAMDDIKSGNLYNTERADKAFDDMFDDSIFGDLDDMFDEEPSGDTNVYVSNQSSNDEQTAASIDRQTEYQIKNTKATVDTMVAVSSINLVKMTELGDKIINSLTSIDSNIAALVEYNNTNMTRFIEASIGYYGQKEEDSSYKTKRLEMRDVIGSDGGLDFGNYAKMIKQNIGDIKNDSMAMTMMSMVLENKEMLISNPVGAILQGAIKATIPTSIKASMELVDKTVKEAIPVLLEELSILGEGGSGINNEIVKIIGKTFGVKVKTKKNIDLSDTVNKDPMQYNGKADHTIVEIIPKYLRESNSYLREIAEKITGKGNDDLLKTTQGYDWNTNTFKQITDMQKEIYDSILNDVTNTFSMSDFGKEMFKSVHSQAISEDDQKDIPDALNRLYLSIEQLDTKQSIKDTDVINELIAELGDYSNDLKTAVEKSLLTLSADDGLLLNARSARLNARQRKNQSINSASENENIHQAMAQGDFESYAKTRYKGTGGGQGGGLNPIGVSEDDRAGIQGEVKGAGSIVSTIHAIMNGDHQRISRDIGATLGEVLTKSASTISEHFLLPFKKTLFGEKNADGYQQGGIFEGVDNYLKESYFSFRRLMTGKGYTAADGSSVSDANEDEMKDTVLGRFKGMAVYFKDAVKEKLFGSDEVDEEGNKKEGVLTKFAHSFSDIGGTMTAGLIGWQQALFGEDGESPEDTIKQLKEKAKDALPTALAGSIAGMGVGALSGGVLGTLVGGPIGGALLGFAAGIASKSDKFKNWLFGEEKDGQRVGGLISQKVQKYTKENGKLLLGAGAVGAVMGTIKAAMFGAGSSGILGTLVGGPLAGAILGIGSTMLFKSKMFNEFLFGNEVAGRKGIITSIKNSFGKFGTGVKKMTLDKKTIGMGILGGIGGGLAGIGTNIAMSGILGLALGPAGPIGGAILGLGASILAQQHGFREWLFGSTDEDGIKKEGILGQAKNMLVANVFQPMATTFKYIGRDAKIFMEDQLAKIQIFAQPMLTAVGDFVQKTGEKIGAFASDVGKGIKDTFLNGIVPMFAKILSPATKAVGEMAKGLYSLGKTIVGLPVNLLFNVTKMITSPIFKAIKGTVGFISKAIDNVLIKPLNKIVIQPIFKVLTKSAELIGNVVSAPFKLLGKGAEFLNNKIIGAAQHVERFFTRIRDDAAMWFKDTVTEPLKAIYDSMKTSFKTWLGEIVSPLVDFGKVAMKSIKDAALGGMKWIFGSIFKYTLGSKGIGGGIKWLWNKGKDAVTDSRDEGKRIKRGEREERDEERTKTNKRRSFMDYASDVWNGTKDGYMLTDFTGKDATTGEQAERLRQETANKKAENDRLYREEKARNKNSNLIAKYTNNQRVEDTKENRIIAEKMRGKKINWGDVETLDAIKEREAADATIKTQEINTEIKEATDVTNDWLEKIYHAFTGTKPKEKEALKIEDKIADYDKTAERLGKRDKKIKESTYNDGTRNETAIDKAYSDASSERQDQLTDITNRRGGFKGVWDLFTTGADMLKAERTRNKKRKKEQHEDENIDAHWKGSNGAKRGLAIVGEQGPEAMYRKGSSFGKLVGMNGPEVVKMQGGETVIPNNKLPRYENGVGEMALNMSDMDNDDLINEANPEKLSIFERILRELVAIKRNTDSTSENDTEKPSILEMANPVRAIPGIGDTIGNLFNTEEENIAKREEIQKAEMAEVTGNSYEKVMAEKDAKEYKEIKTPVVFDMMAQGISNMFYEMKSHNKLFDFIFSKNGLITGAIIAGLPYIVDFLQSDLFKTFLSIGKTMLEGVGSFFIEHGETIVNTVGDIALGIGSFITTYGPIIIDVLGKVTGTVGEGLSAIFAQLEKQNEVTNEYGTRDGMDIYESTASWTNNLSDATHSLSQGDIMGAYSNLALEDNHATSATARINDVAIRLGTQTPATIVGMVDKGIENITTKGTNFAATNKVAGFKDYLHVFNPFTSDTPTTKNLSSKLPKIIRTPVKMVEGYANLVDTQVRGNERIAQFGKSMLDKGVSAVKSATSQIGESINTKLLAQYSDDATEALISSTDKKLLDATIDILKKFSDDVYTFLIEKCAPKLKKMTPEIIETVIDILKKKFPQIAGKVAAKIGISAGLATISAGISLLFTEGGGAIMGGIAGLSDPRNLFQIGPDAPVDFLMTYISAAFSAVTGTTPGAILDLINELVVLSTGFNFYSAYATFLYTTINDLFGNDEAIDEFLENQASFSTEYKESTDKILKVQYEGLKASGAIDSSVTFEQYKSGVGDGTYSGKSQSLDEYNDAQNKDIWENIGIGIGDFFNPNGKNYLYDKDSSTVYVKQTNGTYIAQEAVSGKVIENIEPITYSDLEFIGTEHFSNTDDLSNAIIKYEASKQTDGGMGGAGTISSNNPLELNGIPYYSQNDRRWASMSYGYNDNDTMSDAGCGPTALSMLISEITDKKIDPITMAKLAQKTGMRDDTGTNSEFVNIAANSYGITSENILNPQINDLMQALNNNNPVLLLGEDHGTGRTPYTSDGHYVVATDIDNDGMVTYNDPISKERSGKKYIGDFINQTQSLWKFGNKQTYRQSIGIGGKGFDGVDMEDIDKEANKNPYLYYENGDGTYYNANEPSKVITFDEIPKMKTTTIITASGGEAYYPYYDGTDTTVSKTRSDNVIFTTSGTVARHTIGSPYITNMNQALSVTQATNKFNNTLLKNQIAPDIVVTIAKGEVGYLAKTKDADLYDKLLYPSSTAKYTKYAKEIPLNPTEHWATTFVTWVFFKACKDNKTILKEMLYGTTASASVLYKGFVARDLIGDIYSGSIGDIIFFKETAIANNKTPSSKVAIITNINTSTKQYTYVYGAGNAVSTDGITGSGVVEESTSMGSIAILGIGKVPYNATGTQSEEGAKIIEDIQSKVTNIGVEGTETLTTDSAPNPVVETVKKTASTVWDILSLIGDVAGKTFNAMGNFILGGGEPISWSDVFKPDESNEETTETSGTNDASGGTYSPKPNNKSTGTYSNIPDYFMKKQPRGKYGITSDFGPRNYGDGWHDGMDYGESGYDETGDPTYSPINGKVLGSKWYGSGGNGVQIEDDYGYKHVFYHFDKPSHLKAGDIVKVGDDLGPVGSTGDSTGPHIHHGVLDLATNEYINPYNYPVELFEQMHNQGQYTIPTTDDLSNSTSASWNPFYNSSIINDKEKYSNSPFSDTYRDSIGIGGAHQEDDTPVTTSISTKSISNRMEALKSSTTSDNVEKLLIQAVELLTSISDKSDNLKLLKDLKDKQNSSLLVTNTNNSISSNQGTQTVSKQNRKASVGSDDARKIAFGY